MPGAGGIHVHCDDGRVNRRRRALAEAWCELLESGREGRLVVNGLSMQPTLRPGWTVLVRAAQPAHLRVGDVAVFFLAHDTPPRSRLVAHRILANLGWGRKRLLLEKGDAALQARRLTPADVVGQVVAVLDDRGRRVPETGWRWSWARSLVASAVVFLRLAAARARSNV
jgi:hypothetical protein